MNFSQIDRVRKNQEEKSNFIASLFYKTVIGRVCGVSRDTCDTRFSIYIYLSNRKSMQIYLQILDFISIFGNIVRKQNLNQQKQVQI